MDDHLVSLQEAWGQMAGPEWQDLGLSWQVKLKALCPCLFPFPFLPSPPIQWMNPHGCTPVHSVPHPAPWTPPGLSIWCAWKCAPRSWDCIQ